MSKNFARALGLDKSIIQSLLELPGTKSMLDLQHRAHDLSAIKASLTRGLLPRPETIE